MTNETQFYDWPKTLSYNAPLTLVVGARGIGKTFGLRLQCIRDFIRDGSRFVEIFRYKNEVKGASRGYFDKLALLEELSAWEFKSDQSGGYIRPKGAKEWQRIAYFVPMTRYQDAKKETFARVRRIFLDEFIIDRANQYGRYLPREFARYANIVDTVTRQQAGDGTQPRGYLLGNSLDLINPYFAALGISEPPPPGYRWYEGKTALLHMVPQSEEAAAAKRDETLAGKLLSLADDSEEAASALENAFTVKGDSFIEKDVKVLRPAVALVWRGQELTLWARKDSYTRYHVKPGISRELEQAGRVFYFSRADARIDYRAAKRGEKQLAWLAPVFSAGKITFETPALFETFTQVLSYFSLPI